MFSFDRPFHVNGLPRRYGLGQGIKRVQPTQTCDPITG